MNDYCPIITAHRKWSVESVMETCQKNHLYTCGTNRQYRCMLDSVYFSDPTYENLYKIATDIVKHSEDQTVTNVMTILEKEAVTTTFDIVEETEDGN